MHIYQLVLAKSSIKRKTHFIRLRTCHTADFGQVWPENDTHDWPTNKVVTQQKMPNVAKTMVPLIRGLCLTADFDQTWSKLCPSSKDFATHWTLTKCGPNYAPHWRTLSRSRLWPNVAWIVPLIGGLCHTVDFNQMWSKLCPLLEDFVVQQILTKCGPNCAPHWRTLSRSRLNQIRPKLCPLLEDFVMQQTLTKCYLKCVSCWRILPHCGLQPNVVQAYAFRWRTLSRSGLWPNVVQTCALWQMTLSCYGVWPHMDWQPTHHQTRPVSKQLDSNCQSMQN